MQTREIIWHEFDREFCNNSWTVHTYKESKLRHKLSRIISIGLREQTGRSQTGTLGLFAKLSNWSGARESFNKWVIRLKVFISTDPKEPSAIFESMRRRCRGKSGTLVCSRRFFRAESTSCCVGDCNTQDHMRWPRAGFQRDNARSSGTLAPTYKAHALCIYTNERHRMKYVLLGQRLSRIISPEILAPGLKGKIIQARLSLWNN